MKAWMALALWFAGTWSIMAQVAGENDPDSVFVEWLEAGEIEGVWLYQDIALDWLQDQDTVPRDLHPSRLVRTRMFTVGVPSGASVFDWVSDSGDLVTPVSLKYRVRFTEPRAWDFRLQASENAGDTCLRMSGEGIPGPISTGFLIRPGSVFKEIIAGDFQVNTGFGAVAGSSPVFSVSMGSAGSLCRVGKGIRLHSGIAEGRFFRGLAARMDLAGSELILFASAKDGIHEEVTGLCWKRSFTHSEFGVTGIHVNNQFPPEVREGWAAAFQPDSGRYRRIGIWGQARIPFGIVFAEGGCSGTGGYGWVSGIRWFETHGFSAVMRYMGCTPAYPVTYSLFQSGSATTREGQRLVATFRYAPSRTLEWLGAMEAGLSTWPGTNPKFSHPSSRISQQLKFQSKQQWTFTVSGQLDFSEACSSRPGKLTWKMGYDSDPKQSGPIRFRIGLRQQLQGFDDVLTKGTTVDCSFSLASAGKKFRITSGIRIFNVEAGTDPLYAYEPDVRYGWSAPVLSGSGTRWFTTVRWNIPNFFDLEWKITQTAYSDLKHLGAGNRGGVSGKLQLTWKLSPP
jgi:hypothetical protein